jgi:N-acetyl-anhydromuramyl-L-alanine amidase AmpD
LTENEKKEEAAEAIQTVIARYGYTPEFSYFRKQVGAVVSSLQVSLQINY